MLVPGTTEGWAEGYAKAYTCLEPGWGTVVHIKEGGGALVRAVMTERLCGGVRRVHSWSVGTLAFSSASPRGTGGEGEEAMSSSQTVGENNCVFMTSICPTTVTRMDNIPLRRGTVKPPMGSVGFLKCNPYNASEDIRM